jgi:hypothetical protein
MNGRVHPWTDIAKVGADNRAPPTASGSLARARPVSPELVNPKSFPNVVVARYLLCLCLATGPVPMSCNGAPSSSPDSEDGLLMANDSLNGSLLRRRASVTERRVSAPGVAEGLDVLEDGRSQLPTSCPGPPVEELGQHGGEEGLDHRVGSRRPHPRADGFGAL